MRVEQCCTARAARRTAVSDARADAKRPGRAGKREEADARTRTGDPFITSADRVPRQGRPGRAKPHGSSESANRVWRPKTSDDKDVDPA
jgi:hypothetical protein